MRSGVPRAMRAWPGVDDDAPAAAARCRAAPSARRATPATTRRPARSASTTAAAAVQRSARRIVSRAMTRSGSTSRSRASAARTSRPSSGPGASAASRSVAVTTTSSSAPFCSSASRASCRSLGGRRSGACRPMTAADGRDDGQHEQADEGERRSATSRRRSAHAAPAITATAAACARRHAQPRQGRQRRRRPSSQPRNVWSCAHATVSSRGRRQPAAGSPAIASHTSSAADADQRRTTTGSGPPRARAPPPTARAARGSTLPDRGDDRLPAQRAAAPDSRRSTLTATGRGGVAGRGRCRAGRAPRRARRRRAARTAAPARRSGQVVQRLEHERHERRLTRRRCSSGRVLGAERRREHGDAAGADRLLDQRRQPVGEARDDAPARPGHDAQRPREAAPGRGSAAASPKAAKIGCRASTGDSVVGNAPRVGRLDAQARVADDLAERAGVERLARQQPQRAAAARVVVQHRAASRGSSPRVPLTTITWRARAVSAPSARRGVAAQHLDARSRGPARPIRWPRAAGTDRRPRPARRAARRSAQRRRIEHQIARVVGRDAVGVGDGDARDAARRQPRRQRAPTRSRPGSMATAASATDRSLTARHDLRAARAGCRGW